MSTPALPASGVPPILPLGDRSEVSSIEVPCVEHLVTEDDTPVDSIYSERQMRLLTDPLYDSWSGPGEGQSFVALANVGLFYSLKLPPIVPDVLLSLDVELPQDMREKRNRSYFVWEFGKQPDVGIEVVSNLEGEETGSKQKVYARIGVPYYVIWDPLDLLKIGRLRVLVLRGRSYQPLDKPWFPEVGLGLTRWTGSFQDMEGEWLRWCDRQGQVIPSGKERAEQLAAQLRTLGIEPKS